MNIFASRVAPLCGMNSAPAPIPQASQAGSVAGRARLTGRSGGTGRLPKLSAMVPLVGCLLWLAGTVGSAGAEWDLQYQFGGRDGIRAEAEENTLSRILEMPATERFWQLLSRKYLTNATPEKVDPHHFVALAEPLLTELVEERGAGAIRQQGEDWAWLVAAELSLEQATRWQRHLEQIKQMEAPSLQALAYSFQEPWIVVGSKAELLEAHGDWIRRLAAGDLNWPEGETGDRASSDPWFRLRAAPRLLQGLIPQVQNPPLVELIAGTEGAFTRSRTTLKFSSPLDIPTGRWSIPTNVVLDPVIGFTAMRGGKSLLRQNSFLKALIPEEGADQLFFWNQGHVPFQNYVAVPAERPTNALERFAQQKMPEINEILLTNALGQLAVLTNRTELNWRKLPIVLPFVKPVSVEEEGFLFAGLFPPIPLASVVPDELLEQVRGREELVYYDWEITEARIGNYRATAEIIAMLVGGSSLGTDSVQGQWLAAVSPMLGNTVTEVVLAGDSEVVVVRKSHSGLSAIELVSLARWVNRDDFPSLDWKKIFSVAPVLPEDANPSERKIKVAPGKAGQRKGVKSVTPKRPPYVRPRERRSGAPEAAPKQAGAEESKPEKLEKPERAGEEKEKKENEEDSPC